MKTRSVELRSQEKSTESQKNPEKLNKRAFSSILSAFCCPTDLRPNLVVGGGRRAPLERGSLVPDCGWTYPPQKASKIRTSQNPYLTTRPSNLTIFELFLTFGPSKTLKNDRFPYWRAQKPL